MGVTNGGELPPASRLVSFASAELTRTWAKPYSVSGRDRLRSDPAGPLPRLRARGILRRRGVASG